MSEALATLFEGKEICVIEQNGELFFPLKNIADAWGVKINTLYQILKRNEKKFVGRVSDVHVMSSSTMEETWHKSVNEQGLYVLLGAVNTDRLKDRNVADAVDRFQRWVPELIQKYRKKEIAQVPPTPAILSELKQAREEAEICRCEPRLLLAAVYRKYGETEKAEALQPATPSLVHGETGWLNPTDIGRECGLTAQMVNSWLYNHDFQYPEGPLWRLTARGEAHGEEYMFEATSKHRQIRIRWHPSVLIASGLKRPVSESQIALPARA